VNSDGTLSLTGTPMPAGNGPNVAVIDPTGQYLLVTNNFSNDISVFQIDVTTGGLTQVGSTVPANANPTDIVFTHSGQFVYVTNPGIGMVSIFSFANGVLTQLPGLSPVFSGKGASALVVDNSDSFLYVANVTAINPAPNLSTGNISGFNIDSTSGALTSYKARHSCPRMATARAPSLSIPPVSWFTPSLRDRASPSGVSPSITPVEPRTDRWWPQRALRSACRQAESSLCSIPAETTSLSEATLALRLYLQSIERLSLGGHRVAVCTGNCARENGVLELEA